MTILEQISNRLDELSKTAQPTEAQAEAGNYKKKHIRYNGMEISIENPANSVRSGKGADGKEWRNKMNHHYGYIKRTLGKDKDHIDVFIKPGTKETEKVFIVNQINKNKNFDEHKCMLGFDTKTAAKRAYLMNYEKGWDGCGSIVEMPIDGFKKWVYSGRKMGPAKQLGKDDNMNCGSSHYTKTIKKGKAGMIKRSFLESAYKKGFDNELEKVGGPVSSILRMMWSPGGATGQMVKDLGRRTLQSRSAVRHGVTEAKSALRSAQQNVKSLKSTMSTQQSRVSKLHRRGLMERMVGGRLGTKRRRIIRLGEARTQLKSTRSILPGAQKEVRLTAGRYGSQVKRTKPQLKAIEEQFQREAGGIRRRQFANIAARTGIVGGGLGIAGTGYSKLQNRNRGYY